ncbi:MAG: hypothetical protein EHM14_14830 [Methanothrix sp.]|nr:MAG: hypothetical protein EHM14_14830 [Methanothrix sp.]
MEEKSASITLDLTQWQQRMIKDLFGVKTTKIDMVKDILDLVKYRTPPQESLFNLRVQRMYLEDAQKEQIAKAMGTKATTMCDFIELDHDAILKYAALHKSGLLYRPLGKDE